MDTIKNYLETMFMQLPNTREVLKAKAELGQMMEDKFNELIAEGKPENEAIATVLSEFGNLDEISESLGIKEFVNKAPIDKRVVKLDEAREYVKDRTAAALRTAVGVMLCILCPVGELVIGENMGYRGMGILSLFIILAVGIGLFIYNSVSGEKWSWMEKTPCAVEFGTIDEINRARENYRPLKAIFLCAGITICLLALGIAGAIDEMRYFRNIDDVEGLFFLVFVALGVCLIVYGAVRDNAFTDILKLNDSKTVGGNFVDSQKTAKRLTKTGQIVMSVFWPTVTCIYFIWSFVTMDWYITWIVWPLAPVFKMLIEAIFSDTNSLE
jgi:hypothetical protein